MSSAVPINRISNLHQYVEKETALYQILNAFQIQCDNLTAEIDLVQAQFQSDTVLGRSLDELAKIYDITRRTETDEELRTEVQTAITTKKSQTKDDLAATVNEISGYTPTILEYPDVDFVGSHGMTRNEGCILIQLPANYAEYLADVRIQVEQVKAAGIAAIVEIAEIYVEEFEEVITVSDLLLILSEGIFEENFLTDYIGTLVIGSGKIGNGMSDELQIEMDSDFTEALPNAAHIGTAIIGSSRIAPTPSQEDGLYDFGWDSGEWDDTEWDDNSKIMIMNEVF